MSAPTDSLASQRRRAESLLMGLLRTPKTRSGLIAAVTGRKISRRFVFGWLTEKARTGVVAELKSTRPYTYQLSATLSSESPASGTYPEWLEPRVLPVSVRRVAYLDGQSVEQAPVPKQPKSRRKPK